MAERNSSPEARDEATLRKLAKMINDLPKSQREHEILHLLGWVTRQYRKGKVPYID